MRENKLHALALSDMLFPDAAVHAIGIEEFVMIGQGESCVPLDSMCCTCLV